MPDKGEKYRALLEGLRNQSSTIGGVVLLKIEGTIIASTCNSSCDMETVGSIVPSTMNIIQEALQQFSLDGIEQVTIKGKRDFIVLYPIKQRLILVVLAQLEVALTSLYRHIKATAGKIAEILERG